MLSIEDLLPGASPNLDTAMSSLVVDGLLARVPFSTLEVPSIADLLPGASSNLDTARSSCTPEVLLGVLLTGDWSSAAIPALFVSDPSTPGFKTSSCGDPALGDVRTPFTELEVLPDLLDP